MQLPFFDITFDTSSTFFRIISLLIGLFVIGWLISKIRKGAKVTGRAVSSFGSAVKKGAVEGGKKGWDWGKEKGQPVGKEQGGEKPIDKYLGITGKHLRAKTKFEENLINAKRSLWFGRDGERVHSRKAFMTSKRIADLADDQAELWPSIQSTGVSQGTRFEANNQELHKRIAQLQFYMTELAREIQQEVETERSLIQESQKAAQVQQQEAAGTRQSLMIAQKEGMESKLHHAQTEHEIKALKHEIDVEFKKFREYNTIAQSQLRFLGVNRVVFLKIRDVGWAMLPLLKQFISQNLWTGNGRDNAQQKAHDIVYFCKKIDDDITAKAAFSRLVGREVRKTQALHTKKEHLTREVMHVAR
ncbi:MAG: hypothetical protein KJ574_01210 [Nanoarchaeota archaeon]|nr:hypothetical protein [Nanoarchaeota archaeon]